MSDEIVLKIMKLHEDIDLPVYAKNGDAGMDIRSYESGTLSPGQRRVFGTGLALEVPVGYEIQIRPRSGWALKEGITVLNSPGTIDSNYRGELGIILINHGITPVDIEKGERIAQGILAKVEKARILEVTELSETERGTGGFGSTGR